MKLTTEEYVGNGLWKQVVHDYPRNVDVRFRGKPIDALSREEAIEALHQLLEHTDRPRPFDV